MLTGLLAMIRYIIISLADAYSLLIFIYVFLSWFPTREGIIGDIDAVLGKICDPFLNLFKRLIPPIGGMVDITPIIALFVLQFGVRMIVTLIL